jgi:hypothetical protein
MIVRMTNKLRIYECPALLREVTLFQLRAHSYIRIDSLFVDNKEENDCT